MANNAPVISGVPLDLLLVGDYIPLNGALVDFVLGQNDVVPQPLDLAVNPMVSGESVAVTILSAPGLIVNLQGGESVDVVLSSAPGLVVNPGAGGESVAVTLLSSPGLTVNWWSGESLGAVLQISVFIDANPLSSGQSLDVVLTTQSEQVALETGESLSSSLYVYDLVATTPADGAALDVSLSTYATIPAAFITGETLTVDIEFHDASYLSADYSTGECFTTALEGHAASYPEVTVKTGESMLADLYVKRTALMAVKMASGESLSSSIELPSRASIAINMWTGATFDIPTVSTAPQIGALLVATGESFSLTIGEQENYRIYRGESMQFTLSWSPSVSHAYLTGENCSVVLDIRPSEQFDIQICSGESLAAVNMSVKVAAQLAVTFRSGVWVESSFDDATTSYDLELPCCGPEVGKLPGDSGVFELEGELPSYVRLPEVKLLFTCELSSRPRFQMQFGVGESFDTVERNIDFIDLEPIQQGGFWITGEWLDVTPKHNLCYPNFIPDGDAIVVELEYVDEGCYADYAYTGESFSAVLQTNHLISGGVYTGESIWFDLDIRNPYMEFDFTAGEHLWQADFPADIPCTIGDGVAMSVEFEAPPFPFGCGESVVFALTLTYDVEFMEVGCLDNEFKYQNKYGDEDISKFNAAAVELEPFFHQIKARCY